MAFSAGVLLKRALWRARALSSATRMSSKAYSDAERIVSASISSVSPTELVSRALRYEPSTKTFSAAGHQYQIDK